MIGAFRYYDRRILAELLAIKLYEHNRPERRWTDLTVEQRDEWRRLALQIGDGTWR